MMWGRETACSGNFRMGRRSCQWRQYQCIRCRNLSDRTIFESKEECTRSIIFSSPIWDQDHINGIKEVLEDGSIQVGQALLPGLQRKDDAYLEMEALLKNANVESTV